MALIRRQKLLDRTTSSRSAKVFVIATEGAQTEKKYFEHFNKMAKRPFAGAPVTVEVLPSLDHHSSPSEVLKRILQFVKEVNLDQQDTAWLVLDVDRWQPHVLAKVITESRKNNISVAISNPCFEVWMCFHLSECSDKDIANPPQKRGNTNSQKSRLVRLLRQTLGEYNESSPKMTTFEPLQAEAIERAFKNDRESDHASPWPASPGTHVYKLVKEILDELSVD